MDCVTLAQDTIKKFLFVNETSLLFLLSIVAITVLLGNHLLKTIKNHNLYLFSSESQYMEQIRRHTCPTS